MTTSGTASGRAAVGAVVGGIGAGLLFGIGAVRARLADVPLSSADLDLAALYVFGGILAGAVGGALLPWARTKAGAVIAGMLALQPFVAALVLLETQVDPEAVSVPGFVIGWALVTGALGPVVGLQWIRPWLNNGGEQ